VNRLPVGERKATDTANPADRTAPGDVTGARYCTSMPDAARAWAAELAGGSGTVEPASTRPFSASSTGTPAMVMPSAVKLERTAGAPLPEEAACAVATTRPIRRTPLMVTDSTIDAASATSSSDECAFAVASATALPIAFAPDSEPAALACPEEEPDVLSAMRLTGGRVIVCAGCPGYCDEATSGYEGRFGGGSRSCGSTSEATNPGAPTMVSPG
jgi:hypothetical protein